MAKRRMFSLDIVDTDTFLEMPVSSQALYFHLGMRADDDGFVSSPRKITMMVNCALDDLKLLITKKFVLLIGDGIVVIKDWKINNYIQKDRYTETRYTKEKAELKVEDNGSYILLESPELNEKINRIQSVSKTDTQDRLGKNKESIGEEREGGAQGKREEPIICPSTPRELNSLSPDNSFTICLPHPSLEQAPFDFGILENQIRSGYDKVTQEQNGYPLKLEEVIIIFKVYLHTYEKHIRKTHPQLKSDSIWAIISDFPNCFNEYGEPIELSTDMYEAMIERHFETDYQGKCDYNILHFMSGKIRALRYYETCFE